MNILLTISKIHFGLINRLERCDLQSLTGTVQVGTLYLKMNEIPVNNPKQKRKFATWDSAAKAALIFLFFVAVILIYRNFDLSMFREFIALHQDLTILIGSAALFLASLTFIPTLPITLFLAVLLGPTLALIITAIGNTLSALVHFQIGKQIGDVMKFEEKRADLPFKLGNLPVDSPLFLLLGRVTPGGTKWLSFISGAYSVPIVIYLWTTLLTNLAGAALIAFGGDKLIKFIQALR